MKHLAKLPFSPEGRYLKTSDGKELCCWADAKRLPYRIRLANIRRGQHPPIENAGTLSQLVLGVGSGLAEITHFVILEGGYCGAEFNFYGPRASQLPFYFALKLRGLAPGFRLASLVRPDLQARLAALTDVKMLDLRCRASFADKIEAVNSDLGSAMKAQIRATSARPEDEFELRFIRRKSKKLKEQTAPNSLLTSIRRLGRRSNLVDDVSIFKVQGENGASSFIDVLHEQFTAEKAIKPALDSLGAVDMTSMYEAIEEAYAEVKSQLSRAPDLE